MAMTSVWSLLTDKFATRCLPRINKRLCSDVRVIQQPYPAHKISVTMSQISLQDSYGYLRLQVDSFHCPYPLASQSARGSWRLALEGRYPDSRVPQIGRDPQPSRRVCQVRKTGWRYWDLRRGFETRSHGCRVRYHRAHGTPHDAS